MRLRFPTETNHPVLGESFAEIMQKSLQRCMNEPHFENAPRGQKIKELVNQTLVLQNPLDNLFENDARSIPLRYLAGELIWYFTGDNTLDGISKYSNFWKAIANEDNTLNSAYGNLLFNQPNEYNITEWEWAYTALKKDKDSRQAIMHFNKPEHMRPGVKDFVCTIFGQFFIRDNALNFHVTMRSNDFTFGLTYDLPFFALLMQVMRLHLLPHYPDLGMGALYHNAMSLHIYEKDFETVSNMLNTPFYPAELPEIETPPVDEEGNPSEEVLAVKEGIYDGNEAFYQWLQEQAHG